MKPSYSLACNIAQTLNLVGEKWTLLILHQLFLGNNTYNSLLESLEGIPSNLLSQRLKCLEKASLVRCELYQEHPPRYRYLLTPRAQDLEGVLFSLALWGQKHVKTCPNVLVHRECGGTVEVRYHCYHCGKTIDGSQLQRKAATGRE